ncbi:STAS domain-containing protein [Hymenobacter chitinivorans]|uniref:Anti-anti-sigma regulatory factor n=1 Tax=Hymenobacter chitinivorans DSM 11115 TaxID=1121954 RepID=A0A2M9BSW1_9BACT|nr:STAS domain-containing protein [Hymenobacter chitinivorans]PJJ61035.1 anti-anti-sigma regulatory factor [Hymenobacter chitinivorans DSM 11115]
MRPTPQNFSSVQPLLPTTLVNLDTTPATQLVRRLQRTRQAPPRLLIDCGSLRCLRTLGVSHVISELLVLHRAGAHVWLRNVNPVLYHCLALLKLTDVFHLLPAA